MYSIKDFFMCCLLILIPVIIMLTALYGISEGKVRENITKIILEKSKK